MRVRVFFYSLIFSKSFISMMKFIAAKKYMDHLRQFRFLLMARLQRPKKTNPQSLEFIMFHLRNDYP